MSSEQPSLMQAIGARLRALRTERDLRQEDIANYARVWGLDWTRSTVAAIEAGDRELSLDEFFALPLVYAPLQLPDLFPGDGWVHLCISSRVSWTTPEQHLRNTLLGKAFADVPRPAAAPDIPDDIDYAIVEPFQQLLKKPGHLVRHIKVGEFSDQAAERAFLDLPGNLQHLRREIELAAKGDAERKAARRFGVSPELVSVIAFRRYHRSLSEWRDMRVAERAADSRSLQAIRGHVTRALLSEMKPMIERYHKQHDQSEQSTDRQLSARERRTLAQLSAREREVLTLMANRLANKEIARTLGISERTVQYHVNNLFRHIGVYNRAEAIAWAELNGLRQSQS